MTGRRVLFYVQYLQGVGHLYRAAAMSKAMAAAGLDVHLVSGGIPVPGLDFGKATTHQLPPLKCRDGDFKDLITDDGRPLDEQIRAERRTALLNALEDVSPDAIILEAFPFGRRQMRFELEPFLQASRVREKPPIVICSVRDILQVSDRPGRADEIAQTLIDSFDHVLVHGDPKFIPLDDTFSAAPMIGNLISYTGIVVDRDQSTVREGEGDVLVSAGGGATQSETLLWTALDAFECSASKDRHWRLMAGPNLPEGEFERLSASTPEGVTLERNRTDFKALLAVCGVSVSQAGYNTVADVLQAGCRSVLVPYSALGETEQSFRASRLQEIGRARMICQGDLTPELLADAIDRGLAERERASMDIDLTGAKTSTAYIQEWISGE